MAGGVSFARVWLSLGIYPCSTPTKMITTDRCGHFAVSTTSVVRYIRHCAAFMTMKEQEIDPLLFILRLWLVPVNRFSNQPVDILAGSAFEFDQLGFCFFGDEHGGHLLRLAER